MDKKITDLDFSDVDFSKYKNELKEIQEIFDSLKSNKRFTKKLNKFMEEETEKKYNINYNSLPMNSKYFTKNRNVVSLFIKQKKCNDYCDTGSNLSLYS